MVSNSSLVSYTCLSPNRTSPRNHAIDTITIHCYVGQVTVESAGAWFSLPDAEASCNYVVDKDGRIGLIVDEGDRSWCTSNGDNDHRAVTIEVASDNVHPYTVTDKVYSALIELCADICRRNGISQLLWKGDKTLVGQVGKQNMTAHRWFAPKACPGDYLYSRFGEIAAKVNERLEEVESVTQEQFNSMMETWLALKRGQPVSDWAAEAWSRAKSAGVFDGTAPQAVLTREQAALVLERLGLLEV